MSNTKYILGSFADPDEMMDGIDKLQANNISIYDCFTPMPIHGIEAKLGVKPSRLPIAGFLFGITGTISAISLLYYTMAHDWPMNIGGKPALAMPDFVPVTFELTILFCALGMVATFFFRNHLFPGRLQNSYWADRDCNQSDHTYSVKIPSRCCGFSCHRRIPLPPVQPRCRKCRPVSFYSYLTYFLSLCNTSTAPASRNRAPIFS